MTIQELKDLVLQKIAGQGSQIDIGGALPPVLNGILDTLAATQNITQVIVTVDEGTGTPSAEASVADGALTLNFHNLKGEKGEQGNTGSSVDYPFELVNNLTTDDATKALSAAQGVVLDGKISQLGQEVDTIQEDITRIAPGEKELLTMNASYDATNSSTVITGIAFALCENKTIYKILFRLGNRNYQGSPISAIKVTLRKDDIDGDLLATKMVQFSASDNSLHDVVADFSDAPVTYSGFIFCLIQADGLLKHGDIALSNYFEGQKRYITSTGGYEEGVTGVWGLASSATISFVAYAKYVYAVVPALSVKTEDIEDYAITTEKVADGAITRDKLAEDVNPEAGVAVYLPKDIYAVPGSRLQLFYRGIIAAVDPYLYNIEVSVYNTTTGLTAGAAYPRYYQLDATQDNVGDYSLTINVRNNSNEIIATGASTIHIIAVPSTPVTQKNILTFGASVVSYGFIVKELERRLTTSTGGDKPSNPTGINISNIAFIGRKTGSIETSVHQEATGGLGWANYASAGTNRYRFFISEGGDTIVLNETFAYSGITFTVKEKNITGGEGNISCSFTGSGTVPASGTLPLASGDVDYTSWVLENTSPFFNANTNQIDFANYSTLYCGGAIIDILLSHLGVNSMSGSTWDLDAILANIKTIARAFHSYNSSGKFIISTIAVPDPTGGFGYNYHADGAVSNYYTIVRRFFLFAQAIEELAQDAEFSGYVVHCPVMPECDGEWMYPKYEMQVNNRNTTKEKIGANAYHPSTSNPIGYYMIADAIYQTLCTVI